VNPVGSANLDHLGSQEPQGPKETWGHQDPKAVLDFKDQEVTLVRLVDLESPANKAPLARTD